MKHHNTGLFIATLLALLLGACSEPVIPEVQAPLVDAYRVPEKGTQILQKFPAVIQASDLTPLSFRLDGELIHIAVISGQKITKGGLIARIDATDFELDIKNKKAKVDLAEVSMARAEQMVALGNMAQSTYDELEAKYRIAQAQHENAQVRLNYTELKAPFAGVIASVPADNYQNTATGQVVVTLHRTDKLEVRVELPDAILAKAGGKKDDPSKITLDVSLDAYPGHIFKGSYKEHTTEQNFENKTYSLILEIPKDPQRVVLPGMPGSVEIDLARVMIKALVTRVPLKAVVLPDSYSIKSPHRIIWRIKKDLSVEPVEVLTGSLADSANMEVFGDIKPGDTIVTSGMMYLKAGTVVKVNKKTGGSL